MSDQGRPHLSPGDVRLARFLVWMAMAFFYAILSRPGGAAFLLLAGGFGVATVALHRSDPGDFRWATAGFLSFGFFLMSLVRFAVKRDLMRSGIWPALPSLAGYVDDVLSGEAGRIESEREKPEP